MRLAEINQFTKERGISVRYLKTKHADVLKREGRKISVDVDAYEEKLMKQESETKTGQRKAPTISKRVLFQRELNKLEKCNQFITASGQEVENLKDEIEQEDNEHKAALLAYEIEELQEAITEKEKKKKAAERKMGRLMPPTIHTNQKNPNKKDQS